MVGMAEIELDKGTGEVKLLNYMAVVDCGIPVNPALARIQAEGGIVQGIGMTLTENVTYDHNGRPGGGIPYAVQGPHPAGHGPPEGGV